MTNPNVVYHDAAVSSGDVTLIICLHVFYWRYLFLFVNFVDLFRNKNVGAVFVAECNDGTIRFVD